MTADTMSKDESIRLMQAEIERLRKDVDHWREARRSCIEAGDMMKEEIDRLRELLREGVKYPGGEPPLWRQRVREVLRQSNE